MFIVLEGPDGAGTTLHSQLLAQALRQKGHSVLLTLEPTDGPIGKFIRQSIQGKQSKIPPDALQLLFTADRAMHQSAIRDAIATKTIAISDRYAHSTIAYGDALECDKNWLQNANNKFIQPDCTIFLLPPLSVCLERIARREHKDLLEDTTLQQKVYAAYERLAKEDTSIHIVDTSGNKNEVADIIFKIVSKV